MATTSTSAATPLAAGPRAARAWRTTGAAGRLLCSGVRGSSRPHAEIRAPQRRSRSGRLAAVSVQASEPSIFAEDGPDGRYFEAVVTGFIRTRSGAVLKLLCTPRCAGLSADQREFPVLMDAACATVTASAADRNGLPASLSSLEDLHQKDVRLMYINALSVATPASGAFFVYDLVTEVGNRVPADFSESLGLAIRHQEPVRISCAALLDSTADSLRRMQLACAEDASGIAPEDVALLGSLASRWTDAQSISRASQPAPALTDAALLALLSELRQLHAKSGDLFTRL